jgi:hypothetical protein
MTNASRSRPPAAVIRTVGTLPVTSLNAGVSLETIRRRLGHANAQTVLRYADQRDATTDAEIRTWRRRKITGRPNS